MDGGGRGLGEAGMKRVELKSKLNQEPALINLGTQQNGQWSSTCKRPVVGISVEIRDEGVNVVLKASDRVQL